LGAIHTFRMATEKTNEKPAKKTEKKVNPAVLGAKVSIAKGETFYVEDTPECAAKLEKYGLTDYLV